MSSSRSRPVGTWSVTVLRRSLSQPASFFLQSQVIGTAII